MLTNNKIIEYINKDLEEIKKSYHNSKNSNSKGLIREKWIYLELKKIAFESNSRYLMEAYNILKSEELHKAQDALDYINSIENNIFIPKTKKKLKVFKALLNELLIKYIDASKEYKQALKVGFDKDTFELYQEFIKRTKNISYEIDSIETNSQIEFTKDEDNPLELLKSAKSLEAVAKYYSRSQKSLEDAQKYFKKALLIYEKIYKIDSKYNKDYILALIKAVETYKLDKNYLDIAQNLIFHSTLGKDSEIYLLNKINTLKGLRN